MISTSSTKAAPAPIARLVVMLATAAALAGFAAVASTDTPTRGDVHAAGNCRQFAVVDVRGGVPDSCAGGLTPVQPF